MRNECLITRRDNYPVCVGFLTVNYPPNVTCYISNGIITRYTPDRSGLAVFRVPYEGTWTVYATDGIRTKSETVDIAFADSKIVNISFALNVYTAGDSSDHWVIKPRQSFAPQVSFTNSYIYIRNTGTFESPRRWLFPSFRTADKISFTPYDTMTVRYAMNDPDGAQSGDSGCATFTITDEADLAYETEVLNYNDNPPSTVIARPWIETQGTVPSGTEVYGEVKSEYIDISQISGEHYLYFEHWGGFVSWNFYGLSFHILEITLS